MSGPSYRLLALTYERVLRNIKPMRRELPAVAPTRGLEMLLTRASSPAEGPRPAYFLSPAGLATESSILSVNRPKSLTPAARTLSTTSTTSLNLDRKSTRLNSSHLGISYAVF